MERSVRSLYVAVARPHGYTTPPVPLSSESLEARGSCGNGELKIDQFSIWFAVAFRSRTSQLGSINGGVGFFVRTLTR